MPPITAQCVVDLSSDKWPSIILPVLCTVQLSTFTRRLFSLHTSHKLHKLWVGGRGCRRHTFTHSQTSRHVYAVWLTQRHETSIVVRSSTMQLWSRRNDRRIAKTVIGAAGAATPASRAGRRCTALLLNPVQRRFSSRPTSTVSATKVQHNAQWCAAKHWSA